MAITNCAKGYPAMFPVMGYGIAGGQAQLAPVYNDRAEHATGAYQTMSMQTNKEQDVQYMPMYVGGQAMMMVSPGMGIQMQSGGPSYFPSMSSPFVL
jgi:hypothetical protein